MHVSQLKTGLKVKIDIKEGMEVVGGEDFQGFVTAFFGNKPKIQQWMRDYNLFEIVKIDNMASGIFDSGEVWCFVVIKPVIIGDITEEDFSYKDENGDLIHTITIENFLLEVDE